MKVLFVSGSPKSGTTWLQNILNSHPEIACAGEGHFVELILAPIVKTFQEYNQKLRQVDERVYQGKSFYQPLKKRETVAICRQVILSLMLRQNPPDGTVWIGDKTPRYADMLDELQTLFPDARFIHIVRDPRDVTVSRLFHAGRAGYSNALTVGSEAYYQLVLNSAMSWVRHNKAAILFSETGGRTSFECVFYEKLIETFEEVVSGLFRFLDVESGSGTIGAVKAATNFARMSGRQPGDEDPASFFRKGVAGDWQGRLDRRALEIIDESCGELMRMWGYT